MIRVNLLPQRRGPRAAPQASQRWLLVTLGVVILQVVLLFWFHQTQVEELDELNRKNNVLQQQINDIKKLVSNHEEIKQALEVLRAREDAIAKLQAARSGPTAVLLELGQILTQGKGPTADADKLAQLRKENPLAVYNPAWDTRRLWLMSYIESERVVRIEGLARDGTDVYELAQRLKLSEYFHDVQLLPGKKENNKADKLELVSFALQLRVRY
ncbi:PilN domain-containing protein [Chondromyces apiculatus]|uniref:Type IV pilus biogenesis protein PilN n=1 Tax=Chondromyces apiculatus DSM 436 TaxID=1192034 RepID=A0A017TAW7_9BACT|nr:PilN domain-containing protein [Chondromyces apiculatus]EYF05761.1 Type IV pilus biogenesis protein PilN [Chondromyces apiculatus DSM 436]